MSELRPANSRKAESGRRNANAALTAAKSNVVQQAKLMDSAGTAWHAVKYGNLEMITRLFPSQCNVYSKGPVGENVFHIAMLLNTPSTLAIAKYLVKLYGKTLVNTPYQERKSESDPPGQYEGETALHIAIVNHDFDMVKFLVQNGADVRARAYGSFFQEGSDVYYGEFPLSFAACTGQKDIVSYLKRHGARVNHDRDQWGNTALHMCVYHDQTDMYDHLVEYCGASEHVQNNRSQTPLLLAASLGKVEMLQHVYNKRRRVAWAYGPVTSYSLSLREIDTVQNPREYVPSAIETSVRKGHLEVLGDPLVQTLLQTKWQRFGQATFLAQVSLYLVWVVSQTFLVWLHSDRELYNGRAREALEILGLLLAIVFFVVDALDFAKWTLGVFRRRKLMKAASKYRPPLYPIPGERVEAMSTQKSNFLSRLIASNRSEKAPVTEGVEQQQQQLAGSSSRAFGGAAGAAAAGHDCVDEEAGAAAPGVRAEMQLACVGPAHASSSQQAGPQSAGTGESIAVRMHQAWHSHAALRRKQGGSGTGQHGGSEVAVYLAAAAAAAAAAAVPLALTPEEGPGAGAGGMLGPEDPYNEWHRPGEDPEGGWGADGNSHSSVRGWALSGAAASHRQAGGAPAWVHTTGPAAQALARRGPQPIAEGTTDPPQQQQQQQQQQPSAPAAGAAAAAAAAASPFASAQHAISFNERDHAIAAATAAAAAALASAPTAPPGAGLPAVTATGGMELLAQLHQQLSAGIGAGATALGVPGTTLESLQQQVAALQQLRSPALSASYQLTGTGTVPIGALLGAAPTGPANGGSAGGMGPPLTQLVPGGVAAGLAGMGGVQGYSGPLEQVDFVSVGLGPGPMGLPGGLMSGGKAFAAGAAPANKVTTMLRAETAHGHSERDGPPARVSNPSGLNRVPSLGGSIGDGEIRNRMRGGGGDNVGGGLPRAQTRRQTTALGHYGGGGGGGDADQPDGNAGGDEEAQQDQTTVLARHMNTLWQAYRSYAMRMARDPIMFMHAFHTGCTLVHFIVWAAAYKGMGKPGPTNVQLVEFDDVVVSLMGLSGWVSVLYYSRGHQAVGQLMVVVEWCMWEVIKFVVLFFIFNVGFTLAFYTTAKGSTAVLLGTATTAGSIGNLFFDPMSSIGYGMIQLVRFMYGEAEYDPLAVSPGHRVKTAFGTMYFLLYVAVVLLLLCNVMIAMINRVYSTGWSAAEKQWRLRWAEYVLRAEARMPLSLQQRFRLGEVSFDPVLQTVVYNHVFEVVEEREKEEEREAQVKALEGALEKIRGSKRDGKRG